MGATFPHEHFSFVYGGTTMRNKRSKLAAVSLLLLAAGLFSPSSPASAAPEPSAPPSVTAPDDTQFVAAAAGPQLAKATAAECPPPAEGQRASCIVRTKSGSKFKEQASSVPTLFALQPVPDWCRQAGVMNPDWYLANRYEACGNWKYQLRTTVTQNGVTTITGLMDFTITGYHYGSQNQPTVAHQITIIPSSMTGETIGTTATASAVCSTACTNGNQSFGTQILKTGQASSGEFFYNTTATTWGSVANTGSTWKISLKAPKSTSASTLSSVSTTVRCDTAVPGITSTGCVIPGNTPYIRYDSTKWGSFAAHVKAAQQSGLPGAYKKTPLHRLTNTLLKNKNRSTACGGFTRPTNYSCDEYPFASSYEGAYTGGGTARTFPWCQIKLAGTPSTGATGYSVCMIDAGVNSGAGSVLNSTLFVPKRVIDRDAFYVHIS